MMRELWLWVVRWLRRARARRRVRQRAMLPCLVAALAMAAGCERPKEYIFVPIVRESAPPDSIPDAGPGGQNGIVGPRREAKP